MQKGAGTHLNQSGGPATDTQVIPHYHMTRVNCTVKKRKADEK